MAVQRLRPMSESDLEQVLLWRNHPDVRRYMYSTHEIGIDEHHEWFTQALDNPSKELFIFEHKGQAIGFVNIIRTRVPKVADWGFYLAPDAPKGVGRSLGSLALDYAFGTLDLHKISGQVLAFNQRSISFHKALGFIEEGLLRDQHYDGSEFHNIVCFGMLKDEWQSRSRD